MGCVRGFTGPLCDIGDSLAIDEITTKKFKKTHTKKIFAATGKKEYEKKNLVLGKNFRFIPHFISPKK